MNEVLLAETLGRDTTTQLWREEEGAYRVYVMALPEEGAERTPPWRSPHLFQAFDATREQALALFRASSAKRYVEADEAFPGAE